MERIAKPESENDIRGAIFSSVQSRRLSMPSSGGPLAESCESPAEDAMDRAAKNLLQPDKHSLDKLKRLEGNHGGKDADSERILDAMITFCDRLDRIELALEQVIARSPDNAISASILGAILSRLESLEVLSKRTSQAVENLERLSSEALNQRDPRLNKIIAEVTRLTSRFEHQDKYVTDTATSIVSENRRRFDAIEARLRNKEMNEACERAIEKNTQQIRSVENCFEFLDTKLDHIKAEISGIRERTFNVLPASESEPSTDSKDPACSSQQAR